MTTHNPFRKEDGPLSLQTAGQTLTPIPTSTSTSTSASHAVVPTPSMTVTQEQSDRDALNAEPDDLPPPYTPGPSSNEGETSLEFGPVRPFQQPPRTPLIPQQTGFSISSGSGLSPPPPRHPSISRHSTGTLIPSDFPPPNRYAPPTNPAPSRGYAPPSGSPPTALTSTPGGLRHAPPNGPPPTTLTSTPGVSRYAPPNGPPPSATSPSTSTSPTTPTSVSGASRAAETDGRPTTTPTPGHPLLRNNRVLVYPKGYSCWKCDNTGFKSYDPTHPCRKCWERYSKPFEGPIVYAPWSSNTRSSSSNADTLQKPLPNFRAPTASRPPPVPSTLGRASTMSRTSASWTPPLLGPPVNRPPPGALVVRPGDPRIGGRLCWRCDGHGTVSFLIFDEEACPVCHGAGRTFY